jgi:hypothetical protein
MSGVQFPPSSYFIKEVKKIPYLRAYPGDIILAIPNHGGGTEAWFVSKYDSRFVLMSVSEGTLHPEIEQLYIIVNEELHVHINRIFEGYHVQIVKKGKARITVSILN